MDVMKTSRLGNFAIPATIAAAVLLAPFPAALAQSSGTTAQYQPWSGAAAQQLKNLIADLKAKIAAAEQSQAASPDFLADLKALVAKYEALQSAGAGPTAGSQVFADDFADGNYTSNPTWKVSAGSWAVDMTGTHHGLVSKIRPQANNLNNLNNVLGALLQQQS